MSIKLAITSVLISSVLFAETPNTYINMNYALFTNSDNGTTRDFRPTGFKWTAGYRLKDFNFLSIAVEGSFLTGINDDKKSNATLSNGNIITNPQVSLDQMYNLQAKAIIPIFHQLNTNVYLGGSRAKILENADNFTGSNNWDNSFSYGAGLEYWSSADVSIYGNYIQYFKNLSAVEVGLGFRF